MHESLKWTKTVTTQSVAKLLKQLTLCAAILDSELWVIWVGQKSTFRICECVTLINLPSEDVSNLKSSKSGTRYQSVYMATGNRQHTKCSHYSLGANLYGKINVKINCRTCFPPVWLKCHAAWLPIDPGMSLQVAAMQTSKSASSHCTHFHTYFHPGI